MRKEKSDMFEKLKKDKNSDEYKSWFLNYKPSEELKKKEKQTRKRKIKVKKTVKQPPKKKTLKEILKKYFKK